MKVLIAVDDSETAENTLTWYFKHFHKEGNELIICHQGEQPDLPTVMFTAGGAAFPATEIAAIMTEHNKKMIDMENKYVMKCKNEKVRYKAKFNTIEGKAGPAIVKVAQNEGAELIVIGTRGLGLIKRTVLGSVSTHVVHHAKLPVLICPL